MARAIALEAPLRPVAAGATSQLSLPRSRFGRRSIIPGFGLTFGFTLAWLSLIVLIPLSAVFIRAAGLGWSEFVATAFSERAWAA